MLRARRTRPAALRCATRRRGVTSTSSSSSSGAGSRRRWIQAVGGAAGGAALASVGWWSLGLPPTPSHWSFSSPESRSQLTDLATGATVALAAAASCQHDTAAAAPRQLTGLLELTVESAAGFISRPVPAQRELFVVIHFPGVSRVTPSVLLPSDSEGRRETLQRPSDPHYRSVAAPERRRDPPTSASGAASDAAVVFNQAARLVVRKGTADNIIRVELFEQRRLMAPHFDGTDMIPNRLLGAAEVSLAALAGALTEPEAGGTLTFDLRDKASTGQGLLHCNVRMIPPLTVKRAFWQSFAQVVDANGDGQISEPELRNFLLFLNNDVGSAPSKLTLRQIFGADMKWSLHGRASQVGQRQLPVCCLHVRPMHCG